MNKIILTSLMVLLSSCAAPNINLADYTLSIDLEDNRTIRGYGSRGFEKQINLSNMNIYQNVYKMDSGLVLTYEYAVISPQYRLNYGIHKIIEIVFTDYNVDYIESKNKKYLFKLTNYSEALYLIVDNMNTSKLKFLYGYDKKFMESLYHKVIGNSGDIFLDKAIEDTKAKQILQPDKYIVSSWKQRNIILDGILTKMPLSLHK